MISRWAARASGVRAWAAPPDKVLDGPDHEDVEPAADVRHRRFDFVELLVDVPLPPERPVVGIRQQVVEPVVQPGGQRIRVDRQVPVPAVHLLQRLLQNPLAARIFFAAREVCQVVQRPAQRPRQHEAELERAVVIHPFVAVVRRRLAHVHRAQVRRARRRHAVLGHARIRASDGAHLAVAPRLRGDPFHRVVAVAVRAPAVVVEGDELSAGLEPPAHILQHDGIAVRGKEGGRANLHFGRVFFRVRRALQQRRERPAALRQIDVCTQHGAVPRREGDIAQDRVIGGGIGHGFS